MDNTTEQIINIDVNDFRIQIMSDIHLEMNLYIPRLKVGAEILCLCGDIGYPHKPSYKELLSWASANYKWVFLIAGNHEFYHNNLPMQEIIEEIQTICKNFPNITFLNNTTITVNYGTERTLRIFGATLWSDTLANASDVRYGMNDYKKITYLDETTMIRKRSRITPADTTALYYETRKKLKQAIDQDPDTPLVVLTHHLPSFKFIAPEFITGAGSELNCAYASDCDDLIVSPIIFWAFGHSHRCWNMNINGVKLVSNPLGYPGEDTQRYQDFHSVNISELIRERIKTELGVL